MAKILLIKTLERYRFPYKATPPLGIMYLASVLQQRGAHQVRILDMRLGRLKPADAAAECSRFKPDIVGINSLTPEAPIMHRVAEEIKKRETRCKIIAGGPHVTACPGDGVNDSNIDYVVLGEGEQTLSELVDAILGKGNHFQVKGITFRANGKVVETPPREYIQNLDELPQPSWDLIDLKSYFKYWRFNHALGPKPYMAILTSRGCPFRCVFCHNIMGKKFRARSPENVFSEIETLYNRYNIRNFEIIDDTFNMDKKRAIEICDLIINSGLKIRLSFPNALRGDLMDEELLLKLHQAGTVLISYAPESGSSRLQKEIKKNVNLPKLNDIIAKTHKQGIFTHGFFMLGFPTETQKDLEDTIKFALKAQLDTASFHIANPFPGTELYHLAQRMHKNVDIKFADFTYEQANFNLSELSNKKLFAVQRKLYRDFYLNPKRILWFILHHPHKKGLITYFIMFLIKAIFPRKKETLYIKPFKITSRKIQLEN